MSAAYGGSGGPHRDPYQQTLEERQDAADLALAAHNGRYFWLFLLSLIVLSTGLIERAFG